MADNMALVERVLGQMFPKVLGMKLLEASSDRVRAELVVTAEICTTGQTLHGGAIMTLADFLGASGTFLNLPAGAGTTTLESKTNFISPARVGDKVIATCEPVHKGKSTQVWRTTVAREDGRLVAVVTQTQMVLAGHHRLKRRSPHSFRASRWPSRRRSSPSSSTAARRSTE
jgi:1,4-dihydroxy-2-naphthoyl-CoA hydrolase